MVFWLKMLWKQFHKKHDDKTKKNIKQRIEVEIFKIVTPFSLKKVVDPLHTYMGFFA